MKYLRGSVAIVFAWVAVLGAGGGCASLERLRAPADAASASPAWLEAQKSAIASRAEARWKALIAGDFESAYAYETPARRSVSSLQQYQAMFGNSVAWRLATVKSIQYDPNNVARVLLEVEYDAPIMGVENARGLRQMTEKWLYSDGAWWYISG